jgi:hypothetical protein
MRVQHIDAHVLIVLLDHRKMRFATVECQKACAVRRRIRALKTVQHFNDFVDGSAVDRPRIGSCVRDGGRASVQNGELAIGGEQVQIAALDIAQNAGGTARMTGIVLVGEVPSLTIDGG